MFHFPSSTLFLSLIQCCGCLVWVPSIYTSQTLYLCMHPNHLGLSLASFSTSLVCLQSTSITMQITRRTPFETNMVISLYGKEKLMLSRQHIGQVKEKNGRVCSLHQVGGGYPDIFIIYQRSQRHFAGVYRHYLKVLYHIFILCFW